MGTKYKLHVKGFVKVDSRRTAAAAKYFLITPFVSKINSQTKINLFKNNHLLLIQIMKNLFFRNMF